MVEEESEVFSVRRTKEKRQEGNLKNRNPGAPSRAPAARRCPEGQSHAAVREGARHPLSLAPGDTLPRDGWRGRRAAGMGTTTPPSW